jgi:hypothetical protein
MSGGMRQVFGWAGEGFREHWGDHIALNSGSDRGKGRAPRCTSWVAAGLMAYHPWLGALGTRRLGPIP